MISILFFIFGGVFIFYDFLILMMNPGTFLDNLTAFSHIWTFAGLYLIFVGVWRKKTGHSFWSVWKKSVKIIVSVFASLGVLVAIINLCFILNPKIADIEEHSDYVILLGGGIDKNGTLPKSVINRVEKTSEYMKKNREAICVVTGGTLKWLPYSEAPELKRQLVLRGVDANRILVEDKALDTIQNFQFSCEIIAKNQGVNKSDILKSQVVVVTNRFHLRRAERLAHRMGFENIKGIPAQTPIILIPMSYVREICAYVKLNIRILLTGNPKVITD